VTNRRQYFLALALFAAILLMLIVAAVLTDPRTANVP
jgi:hypothetical protein